MSERPRDWDKELADIDRLIEKMPARPAEPAQPPAGPAGPPAASPARGLPGAAPTRPAPASRPARGQVAGTWILLLLVAALAALLPFWPYAKECGTGLFGYLATVAVVVLGSLWALRLTWRVRSGFGHLIALAALLWGLALGAERVLPRIGYALEEAAWLCQAPPAQQPQQQPPQQQQPQLQSQPQTQSPAPQQRVPPQQAQPAP